MGVNAGNIPMKELLQRMDALCPEATITLEVTEAKPSLHWLMGEYIWNF